MVLRLVPVVVVFCGPVLDVELNVPLGVGGWTFEFIGDVLVGAPVALPCVPIPEAADGPPLALFDDVPVPVPELADAPDDDPPPAAAPPAPPPPPPPPP